MTLPEDYDKGKIIFGIRPLIPSLHVDARHVSAVASHGTASRFVGMSAIHMATITTIMSVGVRSSSLSTAWDEHGYRVEKCVTIR